MAKRSFTQFRQFIECPAASKSRILASRYPEITPQKLEELLEKLLGGLEDQAWSKEMASGRANSTAVRLSSGMTWISFSHLV